MISGYDNIVVIFVLVISLVSSKDAIGEDVTQLTISEEDKLLIFQYLDKDGDNKLNKAEVSRLFNHYENATPTIDKFIALIDGHDADKDISPEELMLFITVWPVSYALHECSFLWSKSSRRQCYEDKIISFVHLVLPNTVIQELYNTKFEHDGENNIGVDQVKGLFLEGDESQKTDDTMNFLREIGGSDKVITQAEFSAYVKQKDLHYESRECLKKEYDTDCLKKNLLRYTKTSLTELDIVLIFKSMLSGKNTMLEPSDLLGPEGCNPPCDPDRFIFILDADGKDSLATFAEFRNFIEKHTVKLRIERSCSDKCPTKAAEISCYRKMLFQVVTDHHVPIWLKLPDTDMMFLFEAMDADNDGQIEVLEDLQKVGFPKETAQKVVREVDGNDKGKTLNLREFNEYVHEPSVIYALSECKKQVRGNKRTSCYQLQLKDYIANVLEKHEVMAFFGFYKSKNSFKIVDSDLETLQVPSTDRDIFIEELSMGDEAVNLAEFRWYVKHMELCTMFKDKECNGDPAKMHNIIMEYLKTKITEMNIQSTFAGFDFNNNGDIEAQDWVDLAHALDRPSIDVHHVIDKMDMPPDLDKLISFDEFRLFLLSNERKERLEKSCIHPGSIQKYSMSCIFDGLLDL